MSDLISKGALFNALANAHDKAEIFAIIQNAPTVEVEPSKIGHWEIAIGYDIRRSFQCSECRKMAFEPSDFCPACGAKMNEVNE